MRFEGLPRQSLETVFGVAKTVGFAALTLSPVVYFLNKADGRYRQTAYDLEEYDLRQEAMCWWTENYPEYVENGFEQIQVYLTGQQNSVE